MTKDIVTIDQVKALEAIANHAHTSKHFDKLGGKEGLFCIAMYAQELGLSPMQCLFGGMSSVQGKIELSPRMMNSMIRKAGHKIHIQKLTDTICELKGERSDTQETYVCVFAIEDAKKAGLARAGGGWEKYPSDMLFARCLSRLARRLFADVISTAYIEGEIEEEPQKVQKIEEALVIQEPKETISKEDVESLEAAILEFDDDVDYRKRLLDSCKKEYGNIQNFSGLPKAALMPLLAAINRRKEKQAAVGE